MRILLQAGCECVPGCILKSLIPMKAVDRGFEGREAGETAHVTAIGEMTISEALKRKARPMKPPLFGV